MQKSAPAIRFSAQLLRPKTKGTEVDWTFLVLPKEASQKLPSRSMTSVEGTLNGHPFQATLEPDGQGSHWLKVTRRMRETAGAQVGQQVELQMAPAALEPEPEVPDDLRQALAESPAKAREVWSDITPVARRDWIHWITSGKKAETRAKRIGVTCSKLAAGDRRPCCFDRSGQYSKRLRSPKSDDSP